MRSEAVLEVAGMYAYRARRSGFFWGLGGLLGLVWLLTADSAQYSAGLAAGLATGQAMIFTTLVALYAKEQFAHERARVIPGYRPAHLGVVIAASAMTAVLFPVILACSYGVWPVGTVAWATIAAGLTWWVVLMGSGIGPMIALIIWALLMTMQGRNLLAWAAHGIGPWAAWGMTLVGLVMTGLAIWRLGTLHEGLRMYYKLADFGGSYPEDDGQPRGLIRIRARWGWLERSSERELDRIERGRMGGMWFRIMRWQPALGQYRAFWLDVGLYTAFCAMYFGTSEDPAAWFAVIGMSLVIMPMMSGLHPWLAKEGRVIWEIVRPVGRREFFFEFGATVLFKMLKAWAILWAAAAIAAFAVGATARMRVDVVIEYAAVSFAAQIFMFGIVAWGLRYRLENGSAVAVVAGMLVSTGAIVAVWHLGLDGSLILAAMMTMAGVVLALLEYRRWLETDLD